MLSQHPIFLGLLAVLCLLLPSAMAAINCFKKGVCVGVPNNDIICIDNKTAVGCLNNDIWYSSSCYLCEDGVGCVCPHCPPKTSTGCDAYNGRCRCRSGYTGFYCNMTRGLDTFNTDYDSQEFADYDSHEFSPLKLECDTCWNETHLVACDEVRQRLLQCPYGCIDEGLSAKCKCNCGPHTRQCDIYGQCTCESGWSACPRGLSGDNCNITDPCYRRPNGFKCTPTSNTTGQIQLCYMDVEILNIPCKRGCASSQACECMCTPGNGRCLSDGSCKCNRGYHGPQCDIPDVCLGKEDGQYCISNSNGTFTSVYCFEGESIDVIECAHGCDNQTNSCTCLNSCNERGQCLNQKCYCWSPYYGEHCEFGPYASELSVTVVLGTIISVILMVTHYLLVLLRYKPRLLEHYKNLPFDENDLEEIIEEFSVLNTTQEEVKDDRPPPRKSANFTVNAESDDESDPTISLLRGTQVTDYGNHNL